MLRLPEGMMRGTDKVKEDEVDPIFEMMREWMGRSRAPAEQDSPAIEHKVGYAFAVGFEPATEVTPSSLRKKDLLFFSEVDRLSLTARQSLAAFVRQGGGIVIGVGPRVDPAVLNETFQELLPFPLAEPFRPPETSLDYERFLNIQTSDLSLPLFREFETSVNGNLADARVYNHYRLRLADAPDPGVAILSLSNGDPLLVQRRYGKGVVLLWTSTLGGAWNSLVVHQACMPLVLRLVNYGVSFRPLSRNVRVGDPLIHEVTSVDGRLFLTTPELKLMEAPRVKQGTREFIRFEETGRPGAYELEREGGEKVASFFVYSPDSESDLRPLTTKMERQLISTLKVQTGDTVDPGLPGTVRDLKRSLWQEGEGTEITTWAFLALFLLFAVDAALVRLWFS
jgi:hypothetical protein